MSIVEILDKLSDALKRTEIELTYAQALDDPRNLVELNDALFEINVLRFQMIAETERAWLAAMDEANLTKVGVRT